MELTQTGLFAGGLLFVAALLYSSVGHAGASGYLAVMALLGVAPDVMKPTALVLNVVVAVIATFKFYRAGSFSWRLFLPLALAAIPFAYLGGTLSLPTHIYKPVVGVILLYAAVRSFFTAKGASQYEVRPVHWLTLAITGAVLGLLSGLTGVGGGIFLSPILLFFRWAQVRVISGIAAAFILVNSVAGLVGVATKSVALHPSKAVWALAVVVGGYIGAEYGSRRLGNPAIQRLLALVLVVAGVKMIATA